MAEDKKNILHMLAIKPELAEQTTIGTEILGGIATFLAMAYIIIVNPLIMSAGGVPLGPSIVATIIVAGVFTILTGLYVKLPIAMAPYMGENAFFAFSLVPLVASLASSGAISLATGEQPWQIALGAVFWGGIIFLVASLLRIGATLSRALPPFLTASWGAAIGFFLLFIGFADAGISVPGVPGAPVTVGQLTSIGTLLAILGTAIALFLVVKKVPGHILWGVMFTLIIGSILAATGNWPGVEFQEISLGVPNLGEIAFKLNFATPWSHPTLIAIIFMLFLIDVVDTLGTGMGIGFVGKFLDERGRLPNLDKLLITDALATTSASLLGTCTSGSYIESATGIVVGARTGLASIVTGLLFLATIPISGVIEAIPPAILQVAVAPALIVLGIIFSESLKAIDFSDIVQAGTAILTIGFMIYTYNIALGFAAGMIAYPLLAIATGRKKELHPLAYILLLFGLLVFVFFPYHTG